MSETGGGKGRIRVTGPPILHPVSLQLCSSESPFRQPLAQSQGWVGPEDRQWVGRPTLASGFSSQPTGALGLRAHTQ